MKYIYMNEFIKDRKDGIPPIAVWDQDSKRLVYANTVDIFDKNGNIVARVKFGGKPPKDLPHEASAWVEVFDLYGNRVAFF